MQHIVSQQRAGVLPAPCCHQRPRLNSSSRHSRSSSRRQQQQHQRPGRTLLVVKARSDEEEPDWDKEMSIFKQRTMAPNQLATLRELESKVSLGRVSSTGRQTTLKKMPAIAHTLLCRLQPDLAHVTAAVAALQHGQL
jgi:hypothetical protein